MDPNEMFITTLTEKTGITYKKILEVYHESGLTDKGKLCELFMTRFQMSFGFANTLADIIVDNEVE